MKKSTREVRQIHRAILVQQCSESDLCKKTGVHKIRSVKNLFIIGSVVSQRHCMINMFQQKVCIQVLWKYLLSGRLR